MALNDDAAVVAAVGYVFVADPGTDAPTPSELTSLDPLTYGAEKQTITMTGTPTGGTFTVKADAADTPASVAYNATAAQLKTAFESLDSVGVGNVITGGTSLASGLTVTFVGKLQGQSRTITISNAGLTGGTTPAAAAVVTTAALDWSNLGHTSRDDMPEWGFDGGDTKVVGSWQKKRLREVADGDPVADFLTVNLEQWDRNSLELYFGEDAANEDGIFGVSGDFTPVEKAVLVIIVDGDEKLGFYAAKASVKRDDSINLPVDELSSLPIKATFLDLTGYRLYDWISEDLFPLAS